MGRWGKVEPITAEVGGRVCNFRSKLEYHWCIWCQLRKEQGIIKNWWFEDEGLEIETKYFRNKKVYLPDFTIQMPDGSYELEETKGFFPAAAATKIKLTAEQYENPITLIFATLPANSKNSKTRDQYMRAKRLEPHIKRVIYDATKTIFEPIKGLFTI